jgi:hypothetical protein
MTWHCIPGPSHTKQRTKLTEPIAFATICKAALPPIAICMYRQLLEFRKRSYTTLVLSASWTIFHRLSYPCCFLLSSSLIPPFPDVFYACSCISSTAVFPPFSLLLAHRYCFLDSVTFAPFVKFLSRVQTGISHRSTHQTEFYILSITLPCSSYFSFILFAMSE